MNDRSRNSATGRNESTGKTPGEQLREQRSVRKMDLHSAAHELHVDTWILEALEDDNYAPLGAPIFVKGHLRNYARLLGLAADDLIAEFEDKAHPAEPRIGSHRPWGQAVESRLPAGWVHSLTWLLAAVLIILAGSWLYMRIAEQERADENSMQAIILEPTSSQLQDDSVPPSDESRGASDVVLRDALEQTEDVVNPGTNDEGVITGSPAANVVPLRLPRDAGEPVLDLEIRFDDESWVEIQEGNGAQLYYDLVPAGTTLLVSGVAPLVLLFGNAPAISLLVDGEPIDFTNRIRRDNTARVRVEAKSPRNGNGV